MSKDARTQAKRGLKNLDKEVRTWTENISEDALIDVLHAIERRVRKLDRTHDIPYIAGYSTDGRTIFIDRHMPRSFSWRGKRIETDRFLVLHEMVEKTLLDQLRLIICTPIKSQCA